MVNVHVYRCSSKAPLLVSGSNRAGQSVELALGADGRRGRPRSAPGQKIFDIRASVEAFDQQLQPPAQRDRAIAGIAALLLLIGMPIGWLSGNTSTGDAIAFVVATLISLALIAGIFLWLLPRERAAGRAARSALVLAIISLVLIVVFWTGFTFGFAAGAVALGLSARGAAPQARGQGKATVAIVLGALVMLLSFVGLLTG